MTQPSPAGQSEPRLAFREPGAPDWRSLDASGGENDAPRKEEGRRNSEELKNSLLASLQMQHVVVLAGSGCSLSAGGPSMADLWDYAVGDPPTEAAKDVAKKAHQDLEDKNIEAFLSRIEAYLLRPRSSPTCVQARPPSSALTFRFHSPYRFVSPRRNRGRVDPTTKSTGALARFRTERAGRRTNRMLAA
jgi:hypothetical protein